MSMSSFAAAFKICVVGAGPSGLYTAMSLLRRLPSSRVDILEQLPVPFGLVRFGVAPDHPEVKAVDQTFVREVVEHDRARVLCNIDVGRDIDVRTLRTLYHAVVLAYGADAEKPLAVPGEELSAVVGARDWVRWYNGYPDLPSPLPMGLDRVEDVVVIGNGNVALDVARILLRPPPQLCTTDIANPALEELRHSTVKRVHLIGRRGPAQASWTARELREIVLGIPEIHTVLPELILSDVDRAELSENRTRRRCVEILQTKRTAGHCTEEGQRQLHFHFLVSPIRFEEDPLESKQLRRILCTRNQLIGPKHGQRATPLHPPATVAIPCQLAIRSVGYVGSKMDGVPMDKAARCIPNIRGRVIISPEITGNWAPLYASGWIRGGSGGNINACKWDAEETAETIADDLGQAVPRGTTSVDLTSVLRTKEINFLDHDHWSKILAREVERGIKLGKPREKFLTRQSMLEAAA